VGREIHRQNQMVEKATKNGTTKETNSPTSVFNLIYFFFSILKKDETATALKLGMYLTFNYLITCY